ncbi:MAG: hypothetical protein ACP5I4_00465 [Oceanipulchritudo sp.]
MSPVTETLSRFIAGLQEKIPEQKVGLTPADAFFTRKVDLPAGLSPSDRTAFIQLSLEGSAPFPIEQLAWGFLSFDGADHAFVYATPKSRLKRLGMDRPESYHQLFPGFISLFGDPPDKPAVRFLSQNGVLSAISLPAGNPVPDAVHSRKIPGEVLTDDTQLEARDKLAASLDTEGYECEDGVWLGEEVQILPDGRLRFLHRHLSASASRGLKSTILPLGEQALWDADLRDQGYAGREQATRQRSTLIWKSLRIAGWTALLLVIFQLSTFILGGVNVWQESKIREIEPLATRVENKLTLADRLTQSTEEDLNPFLLMEAINPVRPDSIFYNKVRSRAFNELEIEGQSSEGVTPVNAFADSIKQMPFVSSVENNSQTRNNQTSFEFLITFSEQPPAPEGGFVVPDESGEDETGEEEKG